MKEEFFFHPLGVFIPELWAFRQKDSPACRELLEEVAILDVGKRRLLAARGNRFAAPLPQEIWEDPSVPRLLSDKKGAFLLFPICGEDLCQILSLYLPRPASLVSSALLLLGRREIRGLTKPSGEDPRLFALLSELLFYLDRLLFAQKSLPFWTVVLRSANFAGCKLKKSGPPAVSLSLAKEEIPPLFAFLTCFFLSVRASGNAAEIDLHPSLCYSVRFGVLSSDERQEKLPETPFLDCSAFRRFSLAKIDSGQRLLLSIRRPGQDVSSGRIPRYTRIFLDCLQ
ncbi:MAG: hypothetical protein IJR88_02065 [Clostridia bacterium]|nr:hypothetical protein [Clostridia bacterium]